MSSLPPLSAVSSPGVLVAMHPGAALRWPRPGVAWAGLGPALKKPAASWERHRPEKAFGRCPEGWEEDERALQVLAELGQKTGRVSWARGFQRVGTARAKSKGG